MIKLKDVRTAYFDVDNTLIAYPGDAQFNLDNSITLEYDKHCIEVTPMQKNLCLMYELRAIGFNIVVWSQGGSDHCERVVKLLGIENLVDLIAPKPEIYIDDLPFNDWYVKRVFKQ